MEQAIIDIKAWSERYGDDVCLERLLSIMQEQLKETDIIGLAVELWKYDN